MKNKTNLNRRIFNKKGLEIHWYFFWIGLFVCVVAFVFAKLSIKTFEGYVGEGQFKILKAAAKAESSLFFIDQSAKYSLQQSIYDLAGNGGILEVAPEDIEDIGLHACGTYKGSFVWIEISKNKDKKNCFKKESLKDNFEYTFNKELNHYLANHPIIIPLDNYDYEIDGAIEVIGKAKSPLEFEILEKELAKRDTEKKIKEQLKAPEKIITSKTPDGLVSFRNSPICGRDKCVLTEDAYKLLIKAQQTANQQGVSLEITSSYRTFEEQVALWNKYGRNRKRVANPYECHPNCPHETGNAIDVRLRGKQMTPNEKRLLEQIMRDAGWVRYANEWWHFECCGTIRYARAQAQGVTVIV